MSLSDILQKQLTDRGERMTPVRRALIEILVAAREPLSPDELHERLQKRRVNINKTTVYRQLENLVRLSVVQEVRLGDRPVRYELSDPHDSHHHHLVCTACGRVEDVELSGDLNKFEKAITRRKKFTVLRHSLEFFGLCRKCQ